MFAGMTYFLDNATGTVPAVEVTAMILEPNDSLPAPYTHRMLSGKISPSWSHRASIKASMAELPPRPLRAWCVCYISSRKSQAG